MEIDIDEQRLVEEARKQVVHRLAVGRGLHAERGNEQAERELVKQVAERARGGEHFPPSFPPD